MRSIVLALVALFAFVATADATHFAQQVVVQKNVVQKNVVRRQIFPRRVVQRQVIKQQLVAPVVQKQFVAPLQVHSYAAPVQAVVVPHVQHFVAPIVVPQLQLQQYQSQLCH